MESSSIATCFRSPSFKVESKAHASDLIASFLQSRGLTEFVVSPYGENGMTGPEVRLSSPSAAQSKILIEACEDALIKRGGAGYAFCQIAPESFSDPASRANNLLLEFEMFGRIDTHRDYGLVFDKDFSLVTRNGHLAYKSDPRTRALAAWVQAHHTVSH